MVKVLINTSDRTELLNVDLHSCKIHRVEELDSWLRTRCGLTKQVDYVFDRQTLGLTQAVPLCESPNSLIMVNERSVHAPPQQLTTQLPIQQASVEDSQLTDALRLQGSVKPTTMFFKCDIRSVILGDYPSLGKRESASADQEEKGKTGNNKNQRSAIEELPKGQNLAQDYSKKIADLMVELESNKQAEQLRKSQTKFLNIRKHKGQVDDRTTQPETQLAHETEFFQPKFAPPEPSLAFLHRLTNKTSLESNILQKQPHPSQSVPNKSSIMTKKDPRAIGDDSTASRQINQSKNVVPPQVELMETSSESEESSNEEDFVQKSLHIKKMIEGKLQKSKDLSTPKSLQVVHQSLRDSAKTNGKGVELKEQLSNNQPGHTDADKSDRDGHQSGHNLTSSSKVRDWKDVLGCSETENEGFERIDFGRLKSMSLLQLRLLFENKRVRFKKVVLDQVGVVPSLTPPLTAKVVKVISEKAFEFETNEGVVVSREGVSFGELFELWLDKRSVEVPSTPVSENFRMVGNFNNPAFKHSVKHELHPLPNSSEKKPQETSKVASSEIPKSLCLKIYKQVNFWFSETNYVKDPFMKAHNNPKDNTMLVSLLLSFPRLKKFTSDFRVLIGSLRLCQNHEGCNYELVGEDRIRRRAVSEKKEEG